MLSPLDFGFPAKGWLEKLLNNNYGKSGEDASGQPGNTWVRERGQVCLVLDVMEQWLRNSHEDDAKYREEGRNVFFIPKRTFDESGVAALSPDAVVYAFLSTLERPPGELTALTKTRLGHAMMAGDLFSVRWLLELGTPLKATEHNSLIDLTQPQQLQDEDSEEAARIRMILSERREQQVQQFRLHLSSEHFQLVQSALRSWVQEFRPSLDSWDKCCPSGDPWDEEDPWDEGDPWCEPYIVAPLDLSHGGMGHEGASLLAEVLEHISCLRSLDLTGNSVGDQGTTALGAALKHNSRLESLYLGDNSIGHQAASPLAEALMHNSCLWSLDLGRNSIGHQGASTLGKALENNCCLQSLNLSTNSIGDEGVSALGEVLKHNSCLRSLYLRENSIGDQGASALGEGLKQNRSLQRLSLQSNRIRSRGASALGEALRCNRSLETLDLSCNRIDERGVPAMAACRRPTLKIYLVDQQKGSCESLDRAPRRAGKSVMGSAAYWRLSTHSS